MVMILKFFSKNYMISKSFPASVMSLGSFLASYMIMNYVPKVILGKFYDDEVISNNCC